MGSDKQNILAATQYLVNWVNVGKGGIEMTAAEQLLVFQAEQASELRLQVRSDRAKLLEPIELRTMKPFVEDTGPPKPSATTLERYSECDPGGNYSSDCEAPFNYDPYRDGYVFIQNAIAFNASFLDEDDCSSLAAKYDNEIDLENGTWDDGFGIHQPCDPTKPFARTVDALWLLENSSSNNSSGNYSGGVIHWAYDYVKKESPEIEGSCSGDAMAGATSGFWCDIALFFCDERIELMANFHVQSAPVRASTILHEVRHIDGYDHDAGKDCPRGGSCDSRYSYRGANTLSIQWLAQFVRMGRYTTPFMKEDVLSFANHVLARRYRTCPDFSLSPQGNFYWTGPSQCE